MCSGEEAEGVAGQLPTEEIRHVTHGSTQPSQQKLGIETRLWRKVCRGPSSNGMDPCVIYRRPTRFSRMLYQQKHCQLGLKKTETEGYQTLKILETGHWLIELLNYKHLRLFKHKEDWLRGAITGLKDRATVGLEGTLNHKGMFSSLETLWHFPIRVQLPWNQRPLYSFHVFPFGTGMSTI